MPVEAQLKDAGHAHRWRLETPNGATSAGVCQTCGAERDGFPNSEAEMGDRKQQNARGKRLKFNGKGAAL